MAAASLAGCLASVHTVELNYPPQLEAARVGLPRAPLATFSARPVVIGAFDDLRRFARIGEKRSRLGFHYGRIEAKDGVEDWLRGALAYELEQLGCSVSLAENEAAARAEEAESSPADASASALLIEGRIAEVFATDRFFLEARVKFTAWVRCACHRKILAVRRYDEEVSIEEGVGIGHAEALGRALERTLRDLAQTIVTSPNCL